MPYFYFFRCKDKTLYAGWTTDIKTREKNHNSGKGAIYTRTHGGGKIIYSEKFKNRGDAMRREAEVKKWPKERKERLMLLKLKHLDDQINTKK